MRIRPSPRLVVPLGLALLVLLAAGCGGPSSPRGTSCRWVAGRPEPVFDPQGPPDALRWALERLLARGLTAVDSSGTVVPAAARGWEWSADSLVLTFHLGSDLTFADGTPCGSDGFRRALLAGLGRTDHATQAWRLGALVGLERVRAGRPLPPLGVETPDESTLVLRLRRPDPALPARLAQPGASAPWSVGPQGGWKGASGLGDYRVLEEEGGRSLVLVRRAAGDGPDTIAVRFQPLTARVLTHLRGHGADLVWPLPSGLDPAVVPAGYRLNVRSAEPPRPLLLVLRADLPPTSRAATRHALALGLNRDRVLEALGVAATRPHDWPPGSGGFDFPAFDEARAREWMEQGGLGRAFHVRMLFDADGAAARVARVLQGGWSRLGIYVEMDPLRGPRLQQELLGGLSHLALVEVPPCSGDLEATLAQLTMPPRGPAVGTFRTGWRTRDFDGWTDPGSGRPRQSAREVGERLSAELVVLPLADLPWTWLSRDGGPVLPFHPGYGPACAECPPTPRVAGRPADPATPTARAKRR